MEVAQGKNGKALSAEVGRRLRERAEGPRCRMCLFPVGEGEGRAARYVDLGPAPGDRDVIIYLPEPLPLGGGEG